MDYIEYSEYQNNGGKLDFPRFTNYKYKAEYKVNQMTFGKIETFANNLKENNKPIPDCIKKLVTEVIETMYLNDTNNVNTNIQSYSNGIESVTYMTGDTVSYKIDKTIYGLFKQYLWQYPNLLYRGVKNNVSYNDNDSEQTSEEVRKD